MKVFSFQKQLAVGRAGEARFLAFYQDIKPLDGRKGDFIGNTQRIIELKLDTYTTDKTANFFMERVRDTKTGKLGGPWQAQEHGAVYFVYTYACGACYWFAVDELVSFLTKTQADYETRQIFNRGWSAEGLLVPRDAVRHLVLKLDFLPELKIS